LRQVPVNCLATLHFLHVAENRPEALHLRHTSKIAGLKLPDPFSDDKADRTSGRCHRKKARLGWPLEPTGAARAALERP
jgi:hypothetical protein